MCANRKGISRLRRGNEQVRLIYSGIRPGGKLEGCPGSMESIVNRNSQSPWSDVRAPVPLVSVLGHTKFLYQRRAAMANSPQWFSRNTGIDSNPSVRYVARVANWRVSYRRILHDWMWIQSGYIHRAELFLLGIELLFSVWWLDGYDQAMYTGCREPTQGSIDASSWLRPITRRCLGRKLQWHTEGNTDNY